LIVEICSKKKEYVVKRPKFSNKKESEV